MGPVAYASGLAGQWRRDHGSPGGLVVKTLADLREDHATAASEVGLLRKPADTEKMAYSAAEFRRCHPDWTVERCWETSRQMHSRKKKEPQF